MTTVFRYRPRDVITASLSDEVFQFYASLRVLQLYHLDGVEDIWVFFTDCNLMSFAVQFDSIGTFDSFCKSQEYWLQACISIKKTNYKISSMKI